ncbi:HAD-IA family hydrolase [Acidovorax sp. NCPPB 4044]|uniref:HAD-IA family hydrolase n=1 Tax=Acidovorax sp. NCPPB 4044 TaxID=2940490 RepID=UPI0023024464|nr:HAD-IA family hydrolase [Acidovorax sp. NCPPB 4044]MDA8520593.1 HAD-IA family hydrolase [Acidovorax sp. NCPPB 4044]
MSEKPSFPEQVRAVLFDLDGTLVDSAPDLAAAADKLRTDRGLPSLPLEKYRPMAGAGARGMLAVALDMTPDHAEFPALREEFFINYEACIQDQTVAFDGVEQLIDQLVEMGLPWGVVTNKASRFSLPLTRAMPLFKTARTVVSGDTTPYAKPHPAPLLEAASRLGVAAGQCVYVGDDERDIVAGLAAGMGTVAALYGYLGTDKVPGMWGAHHSIKFPLGLLKCLPGA